MINPCRVCVCSSAVLLTLIAQTALAASTKLEVVVDAGKQGRANVPVRVPVAVPKSLAGATVATAKTDDGKSIVGQLTRPSLLATAKKATGDTVARELTFILPSLDAGKQATYTFEIATDATSGGDRSGFAWKATPDTFDDLTLGGKHVLRYMHEPLDPQRREQTYKVYHHVFDPFGQRLVTKGPGGLYTHHRGLFFGFNRVSYGDGKKCDVWHCTGKAHQSHEGVVSQEAGPVLGRHLVKIDWHGADGEPFAHELRELTAYNVPGGMLIEFASRVESADGGKVHLDGDPQHAGFHFRADNEVASKTSKQTYYLRPDGQDKPGATRNWPAKKDHVNLPWNAMSFVLGDQRYTACYLDRPENPKEARFSERNYGRFGSYFVYDVEKDKPLEVNYRLWLQEGELDGDQVKALDVDFVEPPVGRVK